ncbi:hypothetical protein GCM10023215_39310 [Pseudonocardia yuanmonensis]|uniref:DUF2269 domain-containing protein n=1 Tax=Pseudonocardia yuanmonensis TaxID=1095914 RepID=A0ABP8WY61_9PSEU
MTVHLVCSLGWVGAVAAFLALAGGAAVSEGGLRSAMLVAAMVVTQTVILPLALASLVSGVVSSLVGPWGLWRHYWVVTKLVLTVVATGVLLLQVRPITALGTAHAHALSSPAGQTLAAGGHAGLASLLLHGGGGVLVLIGITILGIWKPRGEIRRRPATG